MLKLCYEYSLKNISLFFFCSPFPTVAEAIQKELDEYRTSEEEVKKLKNMMVEFFFFNSLLNPFLANVPIYVNIVRCSAA